MPLTCLAGPTWYTLSPGAVPLPLGSVPLPLGAEPLPLGAVSLPLGAVPLPLPMNSGGSLNCSGASLPRPLPLDVSGWNSLCCSIGLWMPLPLYAICCTMYPLLGAIISPLIPF